MVKEQLYHQYVEKVHPNERPLDIMKRQYFLVNNLQNMEKAMARLQIALNEGTQETPVAYSSELCHTGALLLENALLMLINYHGIKGEDGHHQIFQKAKSKTQSRSFGYVHNLQVLGEIYRNYCSVQFPGQNPVIGTEMEATFTSLATYNSNTHRYLAQDNSSIGQVFRKLHEDVFWKDDGNVKFEAFCKTHAYPTLSQSLATTQKLLEALPK